MGKNIILKNSIGENVLYENVGTIVLKDSNRQDLSISVDDTWKPNPTWWDIKTILENDTRDYAYKIAYLFKNTKSSESGLNLNGQAYATSDGAFYETSSLTHTWDLSKDKPCYIDGKEAYKTRYVIVYSNSLLKTRYSQKNVLYFYGLNTSGQTNLSTSFQDYYLLENTPELDFDVGTNLSNAFQYCYSLKKFPNIHTRNVSNMTNMFTYCYSLAEALDIDASSATTLSGMFNTCNGLQRVSWKNTSQVTNTNTMFQSCSSLKSVDNLDMINVTSASGMFTNCKSLTDLKLKNIKVSGLTIGSTSSFGEMLTIDSLVNTIKELWDFSTSGLSKSLTIGNENISKLSNVYVRVIEPTEEMIEDDTYIQDKKPCEVCESTDDGAMLILDYATLKGWTIS